MKNVKMLTSVSVIAVLALLLLVLSVTVVPVGHTGILLTFGKVQDTPMDEGVHFKLPLIQNIIPLDNRIQKMEVETQAFSKDIQTVSAALAVNYQVEKVMTFSIYKNIGVNFEEILIKPATHEALKSVCAHYTAEQLVSERQKVSDEIMEALNNEMSKNGVRVTAFNIVDFDFSEDYIKAVENKQVAEQRKKQADIENQTGIEKAKAEAERIKIEAQGLADAVKIEAEGKAESYRLQNEALSDMNVKMEYINKWDGKLPQIQSGGNDMIFDISNLSTQNAEPSAPTTPIVQPTQQT